MARESSRRGSAPAPNLSAAKILKVSVRIADGEGIAALSMRRLAGELSVTPMALYWHFPGKKQLLDTMAEQVFADARFSDAPDAPWDDRYRDVLATLLGLLRRHPWMGRLVVERIVPMPNYLAALEIMLDCARAAGLNPRLSSSLAQQAVQALVTLTEYEPKRSKGSAEGEAERVDMRATLRTLDADRFPNVRAAARPLTTPDNRNAYYGLGLEMIIGGIRAIADSGAGPRLQRP